MDRILLIEDDPDDETLTLREIRKLGVRDEVMTFRDGETALEYLFGTGSHAGRDTADQPRVILLDMHLPGMDGLEVLRRLQADRRTVEIPVVVLTGSDLEDAKVRSFGLGANGFVRKPLDLGLSLEASQRIALHWLLLNRAVPAGPPRTTSAAERA